MSNTTRPRQMFPESRLMLGMLSPVLGTFLCVCIYFTSVWQAPTFLEWLGKVVVQEVLFTFVALCGVGLVSSIVGPERIRPLVLRIGSRAARAGFALMVGMILYVIYRLLWK